MLHAWETIALNPSYNHLLERKPTYDNTYNYVSGDLRSLADVTDGLVMAGGSLKRGDFAQFRTAKTPADGCCLRERREDEPGFLPPDRKRAAKNSKKLTPRQQYDDFMEQVAAGLQVSLRRCLRTPACRKTFPPVPCPLPPTHPPSRSAARKLLTSPRGAAAALCLRSRSPSRRLPP